VGADRQRRLRQNDRDDPLRRQAAQEEQLTLARLVRVPPEEQLAPLLRAYDEAAAAKRRLMLFGAGIMAIALMVSAIGAEVRPAMLWDKIGSFTSYFDRLFTLDSGARVWTDPHEWFWGLARWARLLGDTVLIAYVATLTGAAAALIAAAPASRNLMRHAWVRFAVRRTLEFCRTVPDIVFALIFVASFGLGLLPGVLALGLHTAGTLGKLFTEIIENIDMRPVEGLASTGGSWLAQVRFGALPQVLSNLTSYILLRFEINVRGATVIGFVGAGGIGEDLLVAIRKFFYSDVSAILLMIVATVMLIDMVSARLRHRLLAPEAR
jgi:phosphonate transport system permease protein